MQRNKQNLIEIQRHPYPPFVPERARVVILGSAPPARFCAETGNHLHPKDLDWYYGSWDRSPNLLWEILFRVLDPAGLPKLVRIRGLETEREARTQIQRSFLQTWLARNLLGMLDILARFERRDGSSSDARLQALEFTDLVSLLRLNPSVDEIFCTSRHRVLAWLKQYLQDERTALRAETEGYSFNLPGDQQTAQTLRRIRVVVLPSPSPIGRIRFPSHQAWLEHLVLEYRRLLAPIIITG